MTTRTSDFQVHLEGRGPLKIRPAVDYLATGGEGAVYRIAQTAIKIFLDPIKMIKEGRIEKIQRLKAWSHNYLVTPRGLAFDDQNDPIGFYMDFVDGGEPLCRLFTNDFRQQRGFDDRQVHVLVDRMRMAMQFAHDHHAFLVDPNELNWLALLMGPNGPEPRAIDTDPWVLDGKVPLSVPVMPSIRDWHNNNKIGILSDWFGWGVVTFQLYTGIHPYKGGLNGYKLNQWEQRMKDNASVFSPGIRLNAAVRDFSAIPPKLRAWYEDEFQHGGRSIPPSPFEVGIVTNTVGRTGRIVVTASGLLVYDKLFADNDRAIRIFPCGVAQLQSGRLIDLNSKRAIGTVSSRDAEVVKVSGGWLIADKAQHGFTYTYVDEKSLQAQQLSLLLQGRHLLRYQNRLFLHTDQGLTELTLRVLGRAILSAGQTWGVMMASATKWFDGVGVMDAMGSTFVIAPFGDSAVARVRVKELDGFHPVAAKSGNRFVVIICIDKQGDYQRFELVFDREYKSYTIQEKQVDTPDLNMSLLPKGVAATIVQDGELLISVPTSGSVNHVQDKDITTAMILSNWDDKVVAIKDGEVWTVRMK